MTQDFLAYWKGRQDLQADAVEDGLKIFSREEGFRSSFEFVVVV